MILWLGFWSVFLCGNGCGDSTATDSRSDGSADNDLERIELSVHDQINQYRQLQGLPELEWNETIAAFCRLHSLDMAAGRVDFGHDGFQERIDDIGQSISFRGAAENVAYNNYTDPAAIAVDGWLNSPGHLANIEGNYDLTGVGVAVSKTGLYYFTQIFIRQ